MAKPVVDRGSCDHHIEKGKGRRDEHGKDLPGPGILPGAQAFEPTASSPDDDHDTCHERTEKPQGTGHEKHPDPVDGRRCARIEHFPAKEHRDGSGICVEAFHRFNRHRKRIAVHRGPPGKEERESPGAGGEAPPGDRHHVPSPGCPAFAIRQGEEKPEAGEAGGVGQQDPRGQAGGHRHAHRESEEQRASQAWPGKLLEEAHQSE